MALLWLLAASPASAEGPHTSVINAAEAAQGQFPFMAFVYFETPLEAGDCSGTLVSSNVVLTAAHCVISEEGVLRSPSRYVVVTGNTDWAAEPRTVSTVTRIAVAAAYRYGGLYAYDHDAAVLQLTSPVTAPSVRLATAAPVGGTGVAIVGWGMRSPEVPPPTSLGYGTTVVQGAGYCGEHVSGFDPAAEFCALDYPSYYQAPCHGDSGGPFLGWTGSEWVEMGIVSHGAEECPTTVPTVGTRVDAFAPGSRRRSANGHRHRLLPPPLQAARPRRPRRPPQAQRCRR